MTRFHLWSITEIMNKFLVTDYGTAMANLGRLHYYIEVSVKNGVLTEKQICEQISKVLPEVSRQLEFCHPSKVLQEQLERLQKRLTLNKSSLETIRVLLEEFQNGVLVELREPAFLIIPADRRYLFEQPKPLFGEKVNDTYLDINMDISAAGRCLALDEWTAVVFHCMRILEIGLRDFGKQVGLLDAELEMKEWGDILKRIDSKIKGLEQIPKSSDKMMKLTFYSEAASNFRYFKDAWRNHVSHSREHYHEQEAWTVWNHTKDFISLLAEHKS